MGLKQVVKSHIDSQIKQSVKYVSRSIPLISIKQLSYQHKNKVIKLYMNTKVSCQNSSPFIPNILKHFQQTQINQQGSDFNQKHVNNEVQSPSHSQALTSISDIVVLDNARQSNMLTNFKHKQGLELQQEGFKLTIVEIQKLKILKNQKNFIRKTNNFNLSLNSRIFSYENGIYTRAKLE
ncbi:unnamed protein product (macronuclear) [Paramecium tetraurelia]|uniref:Uncharacterized protein n=1 Tax=Paramecium tetraurelia TaxID=5888 RepID=A0BWN8_PARTE|nr:uncharacterized protein GSPATT00032807001 [Paramecium tetraurelia]CAK62955.1 unnamed protein product [Paramecium tetraurelia]|eukprot:XP_001430353.1 hypothetical protein (macronuclear) [Paramecium tetraurelia strain d4-2]